MVGAARPVGPFDLVEQLYQVSTGDRVNGPVCYGGRVDEARNQPFALARRPQFLRLRRG